MRTLIFATAMVLALTGTVAAKDMKGCNADWKAAKAAHTTTKHKDFMSACLKGPAAPSTVATPAAPAAPAAKPSIFSHRTPAPAPAAPTKAAPPAMAASTSQPADATAQCKDGAWSKAAHHSGACSHHGGVAKFLR